MVAVETRKMEKQDEGTGGGLSAIPRKFTELKNFFGEVRAELKKVTWPSQKEVYATTVVVIVTSAFFGVYLWGLDLLFDRMVRWIFLQFGAA